MKGKHVRTLPQFRDYSGASLSGADPYGHWSLAGNGTDAGTGGNDMTATNYSGSAYRDADTRGLYAA